MNRIVVSPYVLSLAAFACVASTYPSNDECRNRHGSVFLLMGRIACRKLAKTAYIAQLNLQDRTAARAGKKNGRVDRIKRIERIGRIAP
jgi:hypothetical protein